MPTFLPPLHCLRHFEAAARLGSFKEAARELNLSQGAISQQVAELERFLEVSLFVRQPRKVMLTAEGKRLAYTVRKALAEISASAMEISHRKESAAIRVEVGPFISVRWLTPRLTHFMRKHPDVDVMLCHAFGRHLDESNVEIAIRWGDGHWPGFHTERLLPIDLQPVAAPATPLHLDAASVSSLSHLLIHTMDRGDWTQWLSGAGFAPEIANGGVVLDEPNVAVQTAAAGRGIGMGYFPIMDDEIRHGRLMPAHPIRVRARKAYYLLRSPAARRSSAAKLFSDWLMKEVHEQRGL